MTALVNARGSWNLRTIRAVCLLASAVMFRPSVFGEAFTSVGMVLASAGLLLTIVAEGKILITVENLRRAAAGVVLFVYFALQGLLLSSSRLDFVLKSAVANLVCLLAFSIGLSDSRVRDHFYRMLVTLWALLGISATITVLLSTVVELDQLRIARIPMETQNVESLTASLKGTVYFPMSVGYTRFRAGGATLHRFMSMFREPGIAQAFLLWGFIYAAHRQFPKWTRWGLVAGVVTTISTSGVALLAGTMALWKIWRSRLSIGGKIGLSSLGSAAAIVALLYTPFVGVLDKADTHGASLDSRVLGIRNGIELALEHPFGIGLYSEHSHEYIGINLLGSIGRVGLLGFLLAVAIYFVPLLSRRSVSIAYVVAVLPILATELLSQPLVDAPLVYIVVLFASFARRKQPGLSIPVREAFP